MDTDFLVKIKSEAVKETELFASRDLYKCINCSLQKLRIIKLGIINAIVC